MFPDALKHPHFLVSYEIGFWRVVRLGSRRMRFSGRREEMTFEAPVQTAVALPWRLLVATDGRLSALRLRRIRQPAIFASACVPTSRRSLQAKLKITHSTTIIAQRPMLAIWNEARSGA